MVKTIHRHQIKEQIDNGDNFVLIEALPEKYFNEAHLPGAIQIDYKEVDQKSEKLPVNKGEKIVVYCANAECQNSAKTASHLDSLGYTNVYKYVEGKQDWLDAGFPVQSK